MASPPQRMHKRDAERPGGVTLGWSKCGDALEAKHLTDDWGKTTCRNCCHCEEYREHLRLGGFRAGLRVAVNAVRGVKALYYVHSRIAQGALSEAIEAIEATKPTD